MFTSISGTKNCLFIVLLTKKFSYKMMVQFRHALDLIPNLSPNVEEELLGCLAREVEIYSMNISGKKCLLCPFRVNFS